LIGSRKVQFGTFRSTEREKRGFPFPHRSRTCVSGPGSGRPAPGPRYLGRKKSDVVLFAPRKGKSGVFPFLTDPGLAFRVPDPGGPHPGRGIWVAKSPMWYFLLHGKGKAGFSLSLRIKDVRYRSLIRAPRAGRVDHFLRGHQSLIISRKASTTCRSHIPFRVSSRIINLASLWEKAGLNGLFPVRES